MMLESSIDRQPVDWLLSQGEFEPEFFQVTAGRLSLLYESTHPGTGGLILTFSVPYVSCRGPFHPGRDDVYHAELRRSSSGWRLAELWSMGCGPYG